MAARPRTGPSLLALVVPLLATLCLLASPLSGFVGVAEAEHREYTGPATTSEESGNPSCSDLDDARGEVKFEGGNLTSGTTLPSDDGLLEVTLLNYEESDHGAFFDFEVTDDTERVVSSVFVKQANGGLLYEYPAPVSDDEDLHPQDDAPGNDISHISFCYVEDPGDDGEPALSFDKAALNGEDVVETVGVGGSFDYVLSTTNNGNGVATGVEISDTIPDALAIMSDPTFDGPEGGSCETEGQAVTCTVGDLGSEQTATVAVPVQVPFLDADCGEVTNDGQLTHDGLEEALTASVTVALTGCEAGINLEKEAQIEPDELGMKVVTIINGSTEVITYEYVITNAGNETLSDITLVDDVLGALEVADDTLAPGGSTTVSADYTVTEDDLGDENGTIVNVAVTSGTSDEGETVDDEDDETVHITEIAGVVIEDPEDAAPAPDPEPDAAPEPETEVLGTQLAKTGVFPAASLASSLLLIVLGTGLLAYARRVEPLYRRR